ncbi:MAG: hypothetical protein HUU15_16415 [Candidatus Brocadiae bacterium]|nr:hypothetical protein [Candidatus Brocadiia bacterium]
MPSARASSARFPGGSFRRCLAQPVHGPVLDTVGGVIQHLGDHFPASAGIAGPLALDEGGDAVLIQKEVIQAETAAAVGGIRDAHLAGHQQPAARVFGVDLVAGQQLRIAGQKSL